MTSLASVSGAAVATVAAVLLAALSPAPAEAASSTGDERARFRLVLVPSDDAASVDVSGFSFGLIADRVRSVAGLQFGLVFLDAIRSLTGLQLSLGFNVVDGQLRGGQLAGLATLRFTGAVRATDHLSLLAGVGLGLTTSATVDQPSLGHLATSWPQSDTTFRLFPGVILGLQL